MENNKTTEFIGADGHVYGVEKKEEYDPHDPLNNDIPFFASFSKDGGKIVKTTY
ncbi:MAG: hypothetical protein QMB51_00490 [Patescibacteria group bacterium]